MQSLIYFLKHPSNIESDAIIRSVVTLRIILLGLMLSTLIYSHLSMEAYTHWPTSLSAFAVTFFWSLFVLNNTNTQTASTAAIREILVDIAWIFIVVYCSGRSTNPFIYYYLVITAYSAILLKRNKAWSICGLSVFLYSCLLYADVQSHFEHFSKDFKNHLIGMWVNFVGSAIVITFFISALVQILRSQQEKILAIRENNLKSEQLIGLATVSASTVHNLATPLSTLTILIDELAEDKIISSEHAADLGLMRDQISRCQSTMKELAHLASNSNELSVISLEKLISQFREHYSLHYPNNTPKISCNIEMPVSIRCSSLFKYAIINLLNNAIESSSTQASLYVTRDNTNINFTILNTANESVSKLKERWGQPSTSPKEFGLGIGSFLANTTIEQQGGTVTLNVYPLNGTDCRSSVEVKIQFPLDSQASE